MKLIGNKDGWKRVRLDDVVVRREENDKANARARFDSFVKVDHMEAGSLHLKGVGSQKDEELPPTFYKVFRKGQILFPTRNPHLRRTALAHCDGICGEKTLTLEVNDDVADPRFIPFLFHSASFYDHTAGAIIGSTNPHCRWRDVANYEFLLPPKELQVKLAGLLCAADQNLKADSAALKFQKILQKSFVDERILRCPSSTQYVLEELVESMHGGKSPICLNERFSNGGVGILKTSAITSGVFIPSEAKLVPQNEVENQNIHVVGDSVLINRKNTRDLVGVCCYVVESHKNLYLSDLMWQIRTNAMVRAKYLFYILSSAPLRELLSSISNGTSTSMVNIAKGNVNKIRVHIPSVEKQELLLRDLRLIEKGLADHELTEVASKKVLISLINQIF